MPQFLFGALRNHCRKRPARIAAYSRKKFVCGNSRLWYTTLIRETQTGNARLFPVRISGKG